MSDWIKRVYPFNTEQSVNIIGEFGPLAAMFIINFAYGITAGTWALILSTLAAMVVMWIVLKRLPVFPFVAGSVTIGFGALTILTGDPIWVKIKVTIFNALFAGLLWVGLWMGRNFFQYIFEKTFHYTDEGWRIFTNNFAWFFVATAIANEVVRIGFSTDVWILFKMFGVMPAAGLFAYWQTKAMAKYRLDDPNNPGVILKDAEAAAAATLAAEGEATSPKATVANAASEKGAPTYGFKPAKPPRGKRKLPGTDPSAA
ncbi:MAG: septation protein IspZ [Pseudomonadota bacterium]